MSSDCGHSSSTAPSSGQNDTPAVAKAKPARIGHACNRCQRLRTKCTGLNPCTRCSLDGMACEYRDRKRERNRKLQAESQAQIISLTAERDRLASSLRTLAMTGQTKLPPDTNVSEMIEQCGRSDAPISPAILRSSFESSMSPMTYWLQNQPSGRNELLGEPQEWFKADFVESLAHLQQPLDLKEGNGLSGFAGRTSAVTWIFRTAQHLGMSMADLSNMSDPTGYQEPPGAGVDASVMSCNIDLYVDESDLLSIDEDSIDAYQTPDRATVVLLTQAFFQAMPPSYAFVDGQTFLHETLYCASYRQYAISNKTLMAKANLAWAVGAHYLQALCLDRSHNIDSHLLFYARARAIGIDHRVRIDHPSLQSISALGILAYYLYINSSISRASYVSHDAIRHAIAHGLHLVLTSSDVTPEYLAFRAALWHTLRTQEMMLATRTGRPWTVATIGNGMIPVIKTSASFGAYDAEVQNTWNRFLGAESSTSTTEFHYPVQVLCSHPLNSDLREMQRTAAFAFYSLEVIDDANLQHVCYSSGADNQQAVLDLDMRLRSWRQNLAVQLQWDVRSDTPMLARCRLRLAMRYLSLQMLVHGANFHKLAVQDWKVLNSESTLHSAAACISAAADLLDLLVGNSQLVQIVHILPWWELLYPMSLALSVLLLEVSRETQHISTQESKQLLLLKAGLQILQQLATRSRTMTRAHQLFSLLFNRARQGRSPR